MAKGVLHRHFADFADFLADLVPDRIARLEAQSADLLREVGTGTVAANLAAALTGLFGSVAVAMIGPRRDPPDPADVDHVVAAALAGVLVRSPVPRTPAADHRLAPPEFTRQAPLLPRRRESPVAKSGNKRRGRKKKKANHGKRPNS